MVAKPKRKAVHLECPGCGNRNYRYFRNRDVTKARLEVSKYCKFCQKHTIHVEAR